MSYYGILGMSKEPFSTSPDPDLFYETNETKSILNRLLIDVRLQRGMSVVLGDYGMGKTTISRKLFRLISQRKDIDVYFIMDPGFQSQDDFWIYLHRVFSLHSDKKTKSIFAIKDEIKNYLFKKTVNQGRIITLIIDEAQKLSKESLEILRILLNYETNDKKMLQLILFGQLELLPTITSMPNFCDRISGSYRMQPLNVENIKELINYRIQSCGYNSDIAIFDDSAIEMIYVLSGGSPRRIAKICHNVLVELALQDKKVANATFVEEVMSKDEIFLNLAAPV